MSSPPSYDTPTKNPDGRPLPEGWIAQYDLNYKTWFYVDTKARPPVTTWTHPLGPPPPAPASYAPPSGPPPPNQSPDARSQSSRNAGYAPQGPYPPQDGPYPPQGPGGYYGGAPPTGQGYGGYPPQGPGWGYPPNPGPAYGSGPGYGYGGQPQVVYVKDQEKKSGGYGAGAMAAGVGGGLLGGVLLGEAMDGFGGPDVVVDGDNNDVGGFDDF